MKRIGIVVEYNPFHNGHIYHLNHINKSKDDIVIAIMSSSLVNRGEISVFTKFDKTKIALEYGVDIVIELPSLYSINRADIFSNCAIDILHYIGIDELWFGSEMDDINIFDKYINILNTNEYNLLLKENMKKGLSYKSACAKSLEKFNLPPLKSNDTLGLFYYKRIKEKNYNIEVHTIKRTDNDYLDKSTTGSISSATSIRLAKDNIKPFVPPLTYEIYEKKGFIDNNKIFNYLKYQILSSDNLDNILFVDEGIENSLKNIIKYDNLDDFLCNLTTKRYTTTRIKRTLLCVLFNIKKTDLKLDIDFIRILGYSLNGKNYLSSIKKNINIYTNIKEGINNILDIEFKISKILDIIYKSNLLKDEQKGPILK